MRTDIISNNILPKLITLVLAIATWFYVFDLVNIDSILKKRQTTIQELFDEHDFMVKELPVEPVYKGRTPEGYAVDFDKVRVEPSTISLFAPREAVGQIEQLRTEPVDLAEYTRSTKLVLDIVPPNRYLDIKDKVVELYLPVSKKNGSPAEEHQQKR